MEKPSGGSRRSSGHPSPVAHGFNEERPDGAVEGGDGPRERSSALNVHQAPAPQVHRLCPPAVSRPYQWSSCSLNAEQLNTSLGAAPPVPLVAPGGVAPILIPNRRPASPAPAKRDCLTSIAGL
jgi:hypothetical protein